MITVSRKEIAEIFGYNERYINELVKDKGAPREKHNKYNLVAWIRWHIKYVEDKHKADLEKAKASTPQDILATKNAILKDYDIKEREGELVNAEAVRISWLDEMRMIQSNVDLLQITLKQRLQDIDDNAELNNIITDEFIKVKKKIAGTTIRTE